MSYPTPVTGGILSTGNAAWDAGTNLLPSGQVGGLALHNSGTRTLRVAFSLAEANASRYLSLAPDERRTFTWRVAGTGPEKLFTFGVGGVGQLTYAAVGEGVEISQQFSASPVVLAVPTVADTTERDELDVAAGALVWVADPGAFHQFDGEDWAALATSAALSAPFQIPNVADNAAKAALTATEGDLVWQADTNVAYIYNGSAWVAIQLTSYTVAVDGDWPNPNPTTLAGALDALAARLTIAEGTVSNQTSDISTLNNKVNVLGAKLRNPTLTVGAEGAGAANAIDLTLAAVDGNGNAVAVVDKVRVSLYTNAQRTTYANGAAYTISDVGAGSIDVAQDGSNAVCECSTSNVGALALRITDASGTSGATLYGKLEYVGATGVVIAAAPIYFEITFTA